MKYAKGTRYAYTKKFDDRALYKCVSFYRNEARWSYQKARNGFIRDELAKLNAVSLEDVDRFKRKEILERLEKDKLCSALKLSYDGWKILYDHLERKETIEYYDKSEYEN